MVPICHSSKLTGTNMQVIQPAWLVCIAITQWCPVSRAWLSTRSRLRRPVRISSDLHLSEAEDDEQYYNKLPVGVPDSFRIVAQYPVPSIVSFDSLNLDLADVDRLGLTQDNITLPVALVMMDPLIFPSLSRARKACRKGNVLIHRGPLQTDLKTGEQSIFLAEKSNKGLVGDRVYPGDVIARQVRIGTGSFAVVRHQKPPFDLPVVYEDDFFAIVNKPAGVVVYSHKNAGHGTMTVRACLPFVLQPPKRGTYAVMRRPASVHRLDKPTSGLLCVAKTKPAMMNLSKQFHDRVIKKTYFAIVNGIPMEDAPISVEEALALGVDVDPNDKHGGWQLIDSKQDGRHAVTVWRAVRYAKSLRANDGYLTLVELKPKTGRYHQLRRHMAWECGCPLVGDSEYDEGTASAMSFRDRGLFLCSTRVVLEHPYYNSDDGTIAKSPASCMEKFEQCTSITNDDGRLSMAVEIPLPKKFEGLLNHEEERYHKLGTSASVVGAAGILADHPDDTVNSIN